MIKLDFITEIKENIKRLFIFCGALWVYHVIKYQIVVDPIDVGVVIAILTAGWVIFNGRKAE